MARETKKKVIGIIAGPSLPLGKLVEAEWRAGLTRSGEDYAGDERNVIAAFSNHPKVRDLLQFNEFGLTVQFVTNPPWRETSGELVWTEQDDTRAAAWLQAQRFRVRSQAVVSSCATAVAMETPVHPVRLYLRGIEWDGIPRLDGWLQAYLGADGPDGYLAAVGRRFIISAIARVMKPGCQVDHVLVLEGPQGIGKTSVARVLAVRPEWFAGSLPDVHSKDAALQLVGRWFVEIAELRAIRSSQQEAIKGFLSQPVDTFRAPYARRTGQVARQSVFIGTTNESEYLRDRTGNRRFWPVRCTEIDLKRLMLDRDQLYAEALRAFDAGEPWHLVGDALALAEREQLDRVSVTEIESTVSTYLDQHQMQDVSVRDALVGGLGLNPHDAGYAERAMRLGPHVADAIQRCGWRKHRRATLHGVKETIYRRTGQGGQGE